MILRFAVEIEDDDGWETLKVFEHHFLGKYTVIRVKPTPEDIAEGMPGTIVLVMHTDGPGMNMEGEYKQPNRMWLVSRADNGKIQWERIRSFEEVVDGGRRVPQPHILEGVAQYAEEALPPMSQLGEAAEAPEEDAIVQMHDLSTDDLLDAWQAAGPDERAQIEAIMNIRSRAGR